MSHNYEMVGYKGKHEIKNVFLGIFSHTSPLSLLIVLIPSVRG